MDTELHLTVEEHFKWKEGMFMYEVLNMVVFTVNLTQIEILLIFFRINLECNHLLSMESCNFFLFQFFFLFLYKVVCLIFFFLNTENFIRSTPPHPDIRGDEHSDSTLLPTFSPETPSSLGINVAT